MTAANEYVTIGLIFGIICLLCNLYADQTNKKVKREKSWFFCWKGEMIQKYLLLHETK